MDNSTRYFVLAFSVTISVTIGLLIYVFSQRVVTQPQKIEIIVQEIPKKDNIELDHTVTQAL